MARRMLIDATHPEETRVVVLNGTKLEEFDFETSTKKQIKGNIYLAKITRVEPSLQAAFVEYGGNRHGFLSFSEIHPDYYRIPVSDREALIASEIADSGYGAASEDPGITDSVTPHDFAPDSFSAEDSYPDAEEVSEAAQVPDISAYGEVAEPAMPEDSAPESDDTDGGMPLLSEVDPTVYDTSGDAAAETEATGASGDIEDAPESPTVVETMGDDDLFDPPTPPRTRHLRSYKIQEVIKRRQILLVQITKEERGTKGAALTTYLSLAGRYCVLMPNAGRGGGVSRKITSVADRRRLRELMDELGVPDGMGVIVRTAGSERSQTEIKRDYEYLLRLWDDIRELTLRSSAPAMIYEEGNLIKRAIRDLYTRDIDEILVEGQEGYRTAKEFMRMLMPSHVNRVRLYRDATIPLLHRFQVDAQIDQIHNPVVQLKSGGYIVINPTEALVSIDVNSGRATRERNIEETATKTNIEAAEEIARQLRLRDLAGLVVIDFIDMEESRNQKLVEHKLKEAMKSDRARIQIGRISAFGLLELSRQRLRSSLIEASTQTCPHCNGTGTIRSTESTALVVLRALEEEGIRRRTAEITIFVPTQIALYLLNQKRDALALSERRYAFRVTISNDDTLIPPVYRLERMRSFTAEEIEALPTPQPTEIDEEQEPEAEEAVSAPGETSVIPASALTEDGGEMDKTAADGAGPGQRKRRRRRRRRGSEGGQDNVGQESGGQTDDSAEDGAEEGAHAVNEGTPGFVDGIQEAPAGDLEAGSDDPSAGPRSETDPEGRKRRRGRRGGRRRRREEEGVAPSEALADESDAFGYPSPLDFAQDGRIIAFDDTPVAPEPRITVDPSADVTVQPAAVTPLDAVTEVEPGAVASEEPPAPKRKRSPRRKATPEAEPTSSVDESSDEPQIAAPAAEPVKRPRRTRKKIDQPPPADAVATVADEAPVEPISPLEPEASKETAAVTDSPATEGADSVPAPQPEADAEPDDRPRKTGWWRRLVSSP